MKNLLITGGAGFIGSHLVRLMVNKYPEYRIVNLDKLTYAGNLANLKDIENMSNYKFVKADICDFEKMREVFAEYEIDGNPFGCRESRGSIYQRSVFFCPDKRNGNVKLVASS